MDVFEAINNRRSVRTYKEDQLKEEEVKKILNAGIMAPTARGEQPWHFTVVQNEKLLKEINDSSIDIMSKSGDEFLEAVAKSGRNILHNAPTVIIVSGKESASNIQADCSAAIENILLAAEGLDIGACWLGLIAAFFKVESNVAKLKIPSDYIPLYGVSLGYKVNEEEGNPNRNMDVVNWIK
ncbi:coenzyme F420:L-glutamate ligase [Methanobrevibacter cuticularis]|uniref:Coenzyme F420:L-glutamate ligase n=1 Tax=Methanobrevibacter cuticularis TaxID=47311 RepID=A0A166DNE5_9EURY|nr:nitroreductase family protein [Methanobrevibacter cuticularis]KZX15785.1 coenzyme F420:L-glutamate ligase [Methanobrevibacter cuticularis]